MAGSNKSYTINLPYGAWGNIAYYETNVTLTAKRDYGSDNLVVTAKCSRVSAGDWVDWQLGVGTAQTDADCAWSSFTSENTGTIKHYSGGSYSGTVSKNISVGASAGTKTIYVCFWVNGNYQWASVTVEYGSKGASTITSATNVYFGSAITVKWTPYAKNLYYLLALYNGNSWVCDCTTFINPDQTTEYTHNWTIDYSAVLNMLKNQKSVTLTLRLYTSTALDTSHFIGSSDKKVTITIPENSTYKPTVSVNSISGKDSTFNDWVSGSKPVFNVSVTPKSGATIAMLQLSYGGETYTGNINKTSTSAQTVAITTKTITSDASAWKNYTVKVTDSRGFTNIVTGTINVKPYKAPKLYSYTVRGNGTTLTLSAKYAFSAVDSAGSSSYDNTYAYKITRKKASDTEETSVVSKTTLSDASGIITFTETLEDLETTTYEYYVYLYDKKNTIKTARATGVVCLSMLKGGRGAAFFGEASKVGLEVNSAAYINGRLYQKEYDIEQSLHASSSQNRGLYDNTLSEWTVERRSDGTVSVPNWASTGSATLPVFFNSKGTAQECTIKTITESGTKTVDGVTWYYRKYSDGTMEQVATITKSININTAWGNNYYGSFGSFQYGVAFSAVPNAVAQISSGTNNSTMWAGTTGGYATATYTPSFVVMRSTSATSVSVKMVIYAVGKY